MKRRIVITGLGAVTPIGVGIKNYWEGLITGRNGTGPITLFDPKDYPVKIAAEVKDFDYTPYFDRKKARLLSRGTQFALAAVLMALEDSRWREHPGDGKFGAVNGTSNASQDAIEEAINVLLDHGYNRTMPYVVTKCFPHSAASEAGLMTGFQDDVMTISTGCASGINAVAYAFEEIRKGRCDAYLCSAGEATLTKYVFAYFCRANLLSTRQDPLYRNSCPFDARRDGGVLGEGSGCLMLEELDHARRRGAPIYGEILGWGRCGSGYNTNPNRDESIPRGIGIALELAMKSANVGPTAIDYIGLHGVSDVSLDFWETKAIKQVFGEHAYRIPMSSVKSMIGIPVSAAAMLQLIATVLAMQHDLLPATTHYEEADPRCDLDYIPNKPRRNRIDRALVMVHGFNGSDAAVIIGRAPVP